MIKTKELRLKILVKKSIYLYNEWYNLYYFSVCPSITFKINAVLLESKSDLFSGRIQHEDRFNVMPLSVTSRASMCYPLNPIGEPGRDGFSINDYYLMKIDM